MPSFVIESLHFLEIKCYDMYWMVSKKLLCLFKQNYNYDRGVN